MARMNLLLRQNRTMKKITFLILLISKIAFAQTDGSLDTSFGTGGKVFTNPTTSLEFSQHGLQLSDGSILAGGYTNAFGIDYVIAKYLSDGTLDNTFGNNGIAITEFGIGYSQIKRMALQSDGKIIAAGRGDEDGDFTSFAQVARFNADGSLDTSFGINGRRIRYGGSESDVYGLHVLPDSSIITIGYVLNNNSDILVMKLTPNGGFDNSFGTNGVAVINFGSLPQRAFCSAMNGNKILIGGVVSNPKEQMLLLQLNENGTIDTAFGTNGYTATSFWDQSTFYDYDRGSTLTVSGNKIYQAGFRFITSNDYRISLAKYNTDGTLDTTFSDDGKILINGPGERDFINDIKILNDQSILLGGHSIINNSQLRFIIMKLNPDGSFASDFGTNGSLITPMSGSSTINTLIVNQDNIIAIGSGNTSGDGNFALAKYSYANPLGVESFTNASFATLYPNPVGNMATLAVSDFGDLPTDIAIYDYQGRLLKMIPNNGFNEGNMHIETSGLATGVYFLKLATQTGKSQSIKFVK